MCPGGQVRGRQREQPTGAAVRSREGLGPRSTREWTEVEAGAQASVERGSHGWLWRRRWDLTPWGTEGQCGDGLEEQARQGEGMGSAPVDRDERCGSPTHRPPCLAACGLRKSQSWETGPAHSRLPASPSERRDPSA